MLPEGLPMNEYDIKFSKQEHRIYEIRHWEFGPVEFEGQLIDEMSTLVLNSKVEIFTSILERKFGNDRA